MRISENEMKEIIKESNRKTGDCLTDLSLDFIFEGVTRMFEKYMPDEHNAVNLLWEVREAMLATLPTKEKMIEIALQDENPEELTPFMRFMLKSLAKREHRKAVHRYKLAAAFTRPTVDETMNRIHEMGITQIGE